MGGSKRITMKDVAREAGVAPGTVSRVVNGIPVGKSYQRSVEKAIEKLDYHINRQAQALRSNQNNFVEVILPNLYNPFYSTLADCLGRELTRHSQQMLMCLTRGDPDLEQACMLLPQQQPVNGVICLTDHSDLRIPNDIPIVSIDRLLGPGIPCITSDDYSGGYLAAQKLMNNGCKSLAFLRAGSSLPNETDKRWGGFMYACTDAGVSFESMCVHEDAFSSEFEDFLRAHLHDGHLDFDGLFCATVLLAHQIRNILLRMKLSVPQDVQIIGYGGVKCFSGQEFCCSTIVRPVEEMAQLCVDLILQTSPKLFSCSFQLPVYYAFGGTTNQ
ncbi:MAG: substrate-binding domain-containing protein [Clostridia bacterium]|nr:substrate-binding domain-containing protein [Clostridia bacterium]